MGSRREARTAGIMPIAMTAMYESASPRPAPVLNAGRLWAGGDTPLVPLGADLFRIGDEEHSPDRVRFWNVVNGRALVATLVMPGHSPAERWAGVTTSGRVVAWVAAAAAGVLALWIAVLTEAPATLRQGHMRWWLMAGLCLGLLADEERYE